MTKPTRVILDVNGGDLVAQACVAKFCLGMERPSDGISLISRGDQYYGVRWNKGSIRVYPPQPKPPQPNSVEEERG